MDIRPCTADDFERIHHLNTVAFGYHYDLPSTQKRLSALLKRETDKIYVACVAGLVVGYIHACDYECSYADPQKNILALAVDPAYQGRGIGRALLQAAEAWAQACGCKGMRLVSGYDRTQAHAFYRHCGYTSRKPQENFVKVLPTA